MCQLTSPSLKIVCELPSAAASKSTPTSAGRNNLPGPADFSACVIGAAGAAAAPGMGASACPLRRLPPVDEVEHDPDRLRRHEEELCTVGQANEQIKAAQNADSRHERRGRRSELALR